MFQSFYPAASFAELLRVPYDSIVCVKQVPDTANVTADAMKDDGTVNRASFAGDFQSRGSARAGDGLGGPR